MTAPLDPKKIYAAMELGPASLLNSIPGSNDVFRQFTERLPGVLGELAGEVITPWNFFAAKSAVVRAIIAENIHRRLLAEFPKDEDMSVVFGTDDIDEIVAIAVQRFS